MVTNEGNKHTNRIEQSHTETMYTNIWVTAYKIAEKKPGIPIGIVYEKYLEEAYIYNTIQ